MKTLISPKHAAALLDRSIGNRPIKKSNLHFLIDEMQSGRFVYNGESMIVCADGQLLDGHHRCAAIVATGLSQEIELVTVESPKAFATIDQGITRSVADVLAISGSPYPIQLSAAIRYGMCYETAGKSLLLRTPVPRELAGPFLQKHPQLNFWCGTIVGNRFMRAGHAFYLMLMGRTFGTERAITFETNMRQGTNLSDTSPELHLRNKFHAVSLPEELHARYTVKSMLAAGRNIPMGILKIGPGDALQRFPPAGP